MGLEENRTLLVAPNIEDLPKVCELIQACDKLDKLQISIYLLEEERFIYCSSALKCTLGKSAIDLLNNGWGCWFSQIVPNEQELIRNRIGNFLSAPNFQTPYILKYHLERKNGKEMFVRHEILIHSIDKKTLAINCFFDITEMEKMDSYLKISHNEEKNVPNEKVAVISPREIEVLELVAEGFSSKQIADRLFISNHTAISHRKNLIDKFNVKNTAQLIKRAYQSIGLW